MEEGLLSRFGLPALGAVLCFGAAIVAWNSTQDVPESAKKRRKARTATIVEANWDVQDDQAYISVKERDLLDQRERARLDARADDFGSGSLLDDAAAAKPSTTVAVPDGATPGVWRVE